MKTKLTSVRLKLSTLSMLKEIMKEKGFNRTETIEYITHAYWDFIKKKKNK